MAIKISPHIGERRKATTGCQHRSARVVGRRTVRGDSVFVLQCPNCGAERVNSDYTAPWQLPADAVDGKQLESLGPKVK
jgi:hypothetical protein